MNETKNVKDKDKDNNPGALNERERTATILAAIDQMNDEFIHCRDYGHSWTAHWAEKLPGRQGFHQDLKCRRCGMFRRRHLDMGGDVVTSTYSRPEGYSIPGVGRLTAGDRGQLRLASVIGTLPREGSVPRKNGRRR